MVDSKIKVETSQMEFGFVFLGSLGSKSTVSRFQLSFSRNTSVNRKEVSSNFVGTRLIECFKGRT